MRNFFENKKTFVILPMQEFESLKELATKTYSEVVKLQKNREKNLSETWLDDQDVNKLLKISTRTLQTMRDTRTLPFSRIGAKIYYKASDIETLLTKNYND